MEVYDAVLEAVVRGINEDCSSCSFARQNLEDIASCGNMNSIVFNARIANWFSEDYPAGDILDLVEDRYINMTTPLPLSTVEFTFGELELSVAGVEVSLTITIGSGSMESTEDFNATTTDAIARMPSTSPVPIVVEDGAERTRATVTVVIITATTMLQFWL